MAREIPSGEITFVRVVVVVMLLEVEVVVQNPMQHRCGHQRHCLPLLFPCLARGGAAINTTKTAYNLCNEINAPLTLHPHMLSAALTTNDVNKFIP